MPSSPDVSCHRCLRLCHHVQATPGSLGSCRVLRSMHCVCDSVGCWDLYVRYVTMVLVDILHQCSGWQRIQEQVPRWLKGQDRVWPQSCSQVCLMCRRDDFGRPISLLRALDSCSLPRKEASTEASFGLGVFKV